MLSDSDVEEEAAEFSSAPVNTSLHLTTTTSRASETMSRRLSASADIPPPTPEHEMRTEGEEDAIMEDTAAGGEGHADETIDEESSEEEVRVKRVEVVPGRPSSGSIAGPRKTRVMVRDAAWSTWWAVLYWVCRESLLLRCQAHDG